MYECMYMYGQKLIMGFWYGSEQGSNHESRAPAQKIPPRFEALTPLQHPLPDKFGWETVGSSGREQKRRLGRRGTYKKFPERSISDHFSLPRLSPISG